MCPRYEWEDNNSSQSSNCQVCNSPYTQYSPNKPDLVCFNSAMRSMGICPPGNPYAAEQPSPPPLPPENGGGMEGGGRGEGGSSAEPTRAKPGDYYCYSHRKSCPVYLCLKRIREQESYCSNHVQACSNSSCSNRTAASQDYCSQHSKRCQESYCSERVASGKDYCSSHGSYCRGISCYRRVSSRGDYCFGCETANRERERQQQREVQAKASEQNRLKSLVKANTSISGEIREVERFSPWFNPNCATVIAENDNYAIWLIVYEPPQRKMPAAEQPSPPPTPPPPPLHPPTTAWRGGEGGSSAEPTRANLFQGSVPPPPSLLGCKPMREYSEGGCIQGPPPSVCDRWERGDATEKKLIWKVLKAKRRK
nr:hypothetical protein [Morchella crassipes]